MNRAENLERVRGSRRPWDIIVIGGGATGAGCALDAASRGLDVLLLEQHDFGKGTSSRSTKLIHGGVRYLRQGNISLVREAMRERGILLRNAPHVVRRQSFIVPCYGIWQKLYYGAGLKLYDLLAGKNSLGASRILSKAETTRRLPTVKKHGLSGGVLYYDGQFDDTRLLIDLVTAAHRHGGAVLNYAKVTSLSKTAAGRIDGVEFEDIDSGEVFSADAAVVINATGAFCDGVRRMSDTATKSLVTPSQGIHLVFDRKFLPLEDAVMIPKTRDGRVLFCIPWLGATLVGTTDAQVDRAGLEPEAGKREIAFILETAAQYLETAPTHEDILSVFAGVRPLVKAGAVKNTASLSRGHTVEIDRSGLLTITGGKWTTYRRMAEDAVNQAARIAGLPPRRSITATLPVPGPAAANDDSDRPIHPGMPFTSGDCLRTVRDEMAITVEDVLARRARVLFLNAAAAIEMAPVVAGLMAVEMGKDKQWVADQIVQFNKLAESYLPK